MLAWTLHRNSASIQQYNPHVRAPRWPELTVQVLTGVTRLHKEGILGSGQTVCVLDSGLDWRHPALGGSFGGNNKVYIAWAQGEEDETGNSVLDEDGHGTHCAVLTFERS